VCVFYYCRTYYKAVRVGGGGEWRTCGPVEKEDAKTRHAWCLFIAVSVEETQKNLPCKRICRVL